MAFEFIELGSKHLCVRKLRFNGKSLLQLSNPFRDKRWRTNNKESPGLVACSAFGPNQARLNCLSQADLVRYQEAGERRVHKLQDRNELVRKELNLGRPHRIHHV